jgi:hypothetical protein
MKIIVHIIFVLRKSRRNFSSEEKIIIIIIRDDYEYMGESPFGKEK